MGMTQAAAEALALRILGWAAERPEVMAGFLGASGAAPGDLAERMGEPETLAALLDHLLADEATMRACAEDLGLRADTALAARAALPGGDAPHWT